uniref:Uncharacterized protein n=1 Tax=Kalanchoe fedtschenkoi TaxID=63787 RepID=A0A7N0TN06_KALFE
MESATEGRPNSAPTSDETKQSASSKKLISSRSSSSSSLSSVNSFRDQLEDSLDRPSVSDVPVSSTPSHDNNLNQLPPKSPNVYSDLESDSGRNLLPPAQQSMENSVGNSPYRIPSSVFARPSSAQADWSVASNESLFSIQMGNMSFARDFMQHLGKSGELGTFKSGELSMHKKSDELGMDAKPAEHNGSEELPDMRPITTGQMMNLANCTQSAYQACPNSHPGVGATEAAAAEMMKEVIRENEQSQGEKVPPQKNGVRSPTSSDDGGASVKSFTFPVSGDSVKSGSEDISLKPLKSGQHPQQPPDSTPRSTNKETSPAAAQQAQATGLFSCFSSCWPARS